MFLLCRGYWIHSKLQCIPNFPTPPKRTTTIEFFLQFRAFIYRVHTESTIQSMYHNNFGPEREGRESAAMLSRIIIGKEYKAQGEITSTYIRAILLINP